MSKKQIISPIPDDVLRFATNLSGVARACSSLVTTTDPIAFDGRLNAYSSGVATGMVPAESNTYSFSFDFTGTKSRKASELFDQTINTLGMDSTVTDLTNGGKHVIVTLPHDRIERLNGLLAKAADEMGSVTGNFYNAATAVRSINQVEGMLAELGVRHVIAESPLTPMFMPQVSVTVSPDHTAATSKLQSIAIQRNGTVDFVDGWRDGKMHSRMGGIRILVTEMDDLREVREAVERDVRASPVLRR